MPFKVFYAKSTNAGISNVFICGLQKLTSVECVKLWVSIFYFSCHDLIRYMRNYMIFKAIQR